ncbi:ERF family protein [Staphylococcus chromogenes]|nr:ERF family protein [Staphylococcus chromogenes]
MSDAPKPIAQVLCEVSRDVGAVKKLDRNEHQKFMFRGIDAVMNAVHPALVKHGVFMQPEVQEIHYSTATTNNNKATNVVRMKYCVTFHGPAGDSLPVVVWGESNDHGDKATAKAHSVALRTALLQALCLPTDEPDPDQDTYEHQAQQAPEPQGPTEEQVAAYQDLSARANQAQTIDELNEIVLEAHKVPCLEPMADLLAFRVGQILNQLNTVADVKKLWRVASTAGVLHLTKEAIQGRANALKAQANTPTPDEAQQTVQQHLGGEPVADHAPQ